MPTAFEAVAEQFRAQSKKSLPDRVGRRFLRRGAQYSALGIREKKQRWVPNGGKGRLVF
jgi:hypothetical protein